MATQESLRMGLQQQRDLAHQCEAGGGCAIIGEKIKLNNGICGINIFFE